MCRILPSLLVTVVWSLVGCDLAGAAFTGAQKTELVNIHNRLREAVYPAATKMNFLTWNTRLESLAQAAATACTGDHNEGGDYAPLGENIYTGFRTNATEIVLAWHIEKVAYSYAKASCDTTGLSPLNSCGHYLQLVTDGVLEFGCGHAVCSGSNMVYCEYAAGSASPPYASGASVCARCPASRGRCLSGLCVNSGMVTMADVRAYDSSATADCKLSCPNCGVAASIGSASLDCFCDCPAAVSSGSFCETRVPNAPLKCTVCASLTTPCQNGGTDLGGANCSCQCPATYVGKQCQVYKPFYQNSMLLGIGLDKFCAFKQCLRVPLTRTVFKASVWSNVRSAIATAVNTYCNSDAASFAVCCSAGTKPDTAKPLVAAADVGYIDNADLATDDSGALTVAVYVNVSSASNTLCPMSQTMLSLAGLQSAIQRAKDTISASLGSCCSAVVLSAATYQSLAGVKYGIVEPPSPTVTVSGDSRSGASPTVTVSGDSRGGASPTVTVSGDSRGGASPTVTVSGDSRGGASPTVTVSGDSRGGASPTVTVSGDSRGGASPTVTVSGDSRGDGQAPRSACVSRSIAWWWLLVPLLMTNLAA